MKLPCQPSFINGKTKFGFSLVEVLTGLSVFTVLMLGVTTLFLRTSTSNRQESTKQYLKENGEAILSDFEVGFKYAQQIVNVNGNGGCAPTPMTSFGFVQIESNTPDIWILQGDQVVANNEPLNSNTIAVSNLTFLCSVDSGTGKATVTLSFSLSEKREGINEGSLEDIEQQSFMRTVVSRNKVSVL